MKKNVKYIISSVISIFLIIFWLFVGLEKARSWQNFRISLQQQTLPDWQWEYCSGWCPLLK